MSTAQLVTDLRRELEAAEARALAAQARIRQAEERARIAQKSAADAWSFARTMLRTGPAKT